MNQGLKEWLHAVALVGGAMLLFALAALISGCEPLREGEGRKITAWGIWAAPMGTPIGIGYWHSERGPDVESEQSAKPRLP